VLSDDDLRCLGRCVELARIALDDGDEPFGSLLVHADGRAPEFADTVKSLYETKFRS
jgi:tRNA(Arg) A34 adenosine deaminase TadA